VSKEPKNKMLTPIEYLKGVGPAKGEALRKELQIENFGDLLQHYPFRYVDKTKITRISEITPESQIVQLRGQIINIRIEGQGGYGKQRLVATLKDPTGSIDLVWFKGVTYFQNSLVINKDYLVFGKPTFFRGIGNFVHPELELVDNKPITLADRWLPVYNSSEKLKKKILDSKGIAKLTRNLVDQLYPEDVPEILPPSILGRNKLISRYKAVINIHNPESEEGIFEAQRRLKFEEFFFFQMRLLQTKHFRKRLPGIFFQKVGDAFNGFYKLLPFELTGAQKRVLKEIRKDTTTGSQMNRLLQGDVGSGKTIVGLLTMLMAIDNGYQTCMMAPTEILAYQHYEGISNMLEELDLRVEILTGSVKGKKRRRLLEALELGLIDILIGTHALIEDYVVYKQLGMVIIDEQHRFGVKQRSKLWTKNSRALPHVLVMTATPIPRTLAMTLYGDLDVSVIDELPPGRKAIKTVHRYEKDRLRIFGFMKDEITKGRQVYIVYPLIEESEHFNYNNLMEGYESIQRAFPAPNYQISIVHGQMHADDKEFEMQRFKNKETQIMVATTVIEVGVDVPNATVMIIESAQRFGLSQLHQLRGRVGRGGEQSYCILLTDVKMSADSRKRIKTMTATNDGFKIAEVDMELRGPGDIEGTIQSGKLGLKLANVIEDNALLVEVREIAAQLLQEDPDLAKPEHEPLKAFLQNKNNKAKLAWSRIS